MIAVHVVQVDVQQSFYLRFLNGFNVRVERATKEISFSHFHFSLFTGTLTKVRSLVEIEGTTLFVK
tara:strand:- start:80 stop:277 length:198 start_codon:yes stop_codon:yes gene_type:complete